jgi:hypothetical protein
MTKSLRGHEAPVPTSGVWKGAGDCFRPIEDVGPPCDGIEWLFPNQFGFPQSSVRQDGWSLWLQV